MDKLAKTIWKKVFDNLYDRSQFDWWWDDIDKETKNEINKEIVQLIQKEITRAITEVIQKEMEKRNVRV